MVTGFPADRAGIRIGDEILAFNDQPITVWKQLSDGIHALPKQEVDASAIAATARSSRPS